MRLITFEKNGAATLGVRAGSEVVDLSIAAPELPPDLIAMLSKGAEALQAAAAAVKRAAPPIVSWLSNLWLMDKTSSHELSVFGQQWSSGTK